VITVLVVDDAPIIREPIAAALRLRGYKTVCAGDGREALDCIAQQRPDLILLDMAMPVMDGLAFLRHLNAKLGPGAIPVILLTAVAEKDYVVQAARLGVRDYLLKSRFSLTELVSRIEHRLDSAKAEAPPVPTMAGAAAGTVAQAATQAAPPATAAVTPTPLAAQPQVAASTSQPTDAAELTPSPDIDAPPAEAVKALKPLVSRSDLTDRLKGVGELKALSPTVSQLMKLTSRPDCSIDQIVRVIRQDQGLSLKILKLANSAIYHRGDPAETIPNAVMRIGLSQIRQAITNISVIDQFSGNGCGEHLVISQFWEHSIAVGLIAAAIARHIGANELETDLMFTSGLLHDVGRLVYAQTMPELYEQVLDAAHRMQLPLDMVESRMLLDNHTDAMEPMLHSWGFPKHLTTPIALHHLPLTDIVRMARSNAREVVILAAANRLAHHLLLGHSGNLALQPTQDMLRYLNVSQLLFKELQADIPAQTQDIRLAVVSTAHEQMWRPRQAVVREQLVQPLRPLYVGADPHLDGFELLLQRLSANDASAPPNLAVVHLTEMRERTALGEQLLAAEREAGVPAIPLLIIAPRPNFHMEEAVTADRPCAVVPTPTTVARLLKAINHLLGGG
jgi:putative nucleotidyltransferase with HDIG domain